MGEVVVFGETFATADEISEFALMEFAEAAESVEENSLGGLAAVMRLLREAIVPDDFARFRAAARANKATAAELMPIIFAVYEQKAERPTQRPSDSSDGPLPTGTNSEGGSVSPVIARLEAKGRPDLALIVAEAQEFRAG